MVIAIGISAFIGAALGFRFNVFALIVATILVAVSTAVMEVAHGDPISSVTSAIVLVVAAIQVSYLGGGIARSAVYGLVPLGRCVDMALDIQKHMEVVGSDGEHVGTIDRTESAERIVLAGDDAKADGKPHLISVDWISYIDSKVHLNRPSARAFLEWRVAA